MNLNLLLLIVAFAWGTTYLGTKTVLVEMAPATMVAVRFGIATVLMLPFALKRLRAMGRSGWWGGGLLGLLLGTSIGIETLGILYGSPTNAGVLIATTVLFAPLIERLFGKVPHLGRLILPAAISVVGCFFVAGHGPMTLGPGDELILTAAVTRALHLVVSKHVVRSEGIDSLAMSVVQFGAVALLAAVVALATGTPLAELASASARIWGVLVYLGAFCTVFAFVVQSHGVRLLAATRVALLLGTEPVFAALTGSWIGGEALSPQRWLGVALVAGAALWVSQPAPLEPAYQS